MKAEDLYQGPLGAAYHERNRTHVRAMRPLRITFLREWLHPYAKDPWLEVGCGEGDNLLYGDIGLDVDKRLAPIVEQKGARFVEGRAQELPFPDACFSVVFCIGLLMHLPDGEWQKALAEMSRVASHVVVIGEYWAPEERDLRWNPVVGTIYTSEGTPGLLWARPYPPPAGWFTISGDHMVEGFDPSVTFLAFVRDHEEKGEN